MMLIVTESEPVFLCTKIVMFSEVIEESLWDEKKGIPIPSERRSVLIENRNTLYENAAKYKFLHLESEAFRQQELIPAKYTCDGININPPIDISAIPEGTKSFAVIVDDPDGANGNFCHWVAWNIPVTDQIKEGENRGVPGMNDFKYYRYFGPCPSSGTHRYYFKVYALDCALNLPACSGRHEVEHAMRNHVLGFGFLLGKYHMRM